MFGNHVDGIDCPVGPGSKALTTKTCPLNIKHPPTGENFSLGCGMCRVKPKDKPTAAKNKATADKKKQDVNPRHNNARGRLLNRK